MDYINELFKSDYDNFERFLIYIHTEDSRTRYERLAAVKIMNYYEEHKQIPQPEKIRRFFLSSIYDDAYLKKLGLDVSYYFILRLKFPLIHLIKRKFEGRTGEGASD